MRLADLALASCCAAAALLAYAPTLHPDYGFTFDDHLAIVNNADVDPARVPAAALLRHDIWGRPLWAAESHKSWRPLLVLSFRWSFASGGMDAAWFRLVGVLAHGVAATPLVYALARQLRLGRSGAFAAALLFAVHPVHVEAVASAVNRAEPLAAACCLAFDLLYCWLAQEKRGAAAWALGAPLLVSFFVAAVGFKETGCCVAGLCLGRELVARLGARRGPLLRPLLRAAFLSCLAALYLSARHAFAARPASPPAYCASWRMAHHAVECDLDASAGFSEGSTLRGSGLLRVTENPVAFTAGLSRVLSVAHLHAVYASLLVWPRVLVAEYAYDCVPVVEAGEANAAGEGRRGDDTTPLQDASTVSQLPAALAEAAAGLPALLLRGGAPAAAVARAALLYLVLLGLAAAGVSAARRRPGSPSGRALLVALGYLGAYFLPASMVFFTVGTHVAERLLYLPSVGLCLLLGLALRGRPSALRLALLFAAAAAAAQRLRRRCEDWRSDAALHRATVRDCPRSAKAHLLLSQQLAREGRAAAALRHAAEARRIHPQYCDVDFAEATALLASDSDAALAAALPAARALLLRSLDCPYSAAAALRSLEALWDADASGAFGPGRRFAALAERAAAFRARRREEERRRRRLPRGRRRRARRRPRARRGRVPAPRPRAAALVRLRLLDRRRDRPARALPPRAARPALRGGRARGPRRPRRGRRRGREGGGRRRAAGRGRARGAAALRGGGGVAGAPGPAARGRRGAGRAGAAGGVAAHRAGRRRVRARVATHAQVAGDDRRARGRRHRLVVGGRGRRGPRRRGAAPLRRQGRGARRREGRGARGVRRAGRTLWTVEVHLSLLSRPRAPLPPLPSRPLLPRRAPLLSPPPRPGCSPSGRRRGRPSPARPGRRRPCRGPAGTRAA